MGFDKSREVQDAHEYLRTGRIPKSEIVIGLVGAVGTELPRIADDIKALLSTHHGYEVLPIRISEEVIPTIVGKPKSRGDDEFHRVDTNMTNGDLARKKTGDNSILALGVAHILGRNRKRRNPPSGTRLAKGKFACIVNSLKRPEEVAALRRIYAEGFFLVGVYRQTEERKQFLIGQYNMSEDQADKLMKRDEDEDETENGSYGQKTGATYHLADFFVHEDDEKKRRGDLRRILDIMFGHPITTPTFDEYAMFLAFSSALRSADLSRQVGAVIARDYAIIATGANECPCFGGGLYWPDNAKPKRRGRDCEIGYDSNKRQKDDMIEKVAAMVSELASLASLDNADLRRKLEQSPIKDIMEYGRPVHAEMEALLACARNNVSCKAATLYCTTFPCHNCAKHIIAAGIERVVFVEPYPKSKTLAFYQDSAYLGLFGDCREKVAFEPFVGVGPRPFFDLFSMHLGSGYPLERKEEKSGNCLQSRWEKNRRQYGALRIPMLPWSYLQKEEFAELAFQKAKGGEKNGAV